MTRIGQIFADLLRGGFEVWMDEGFSVREL